MANAEGAFAVPYVIGCDIGVTNTKIVCVSPAGSILSRQISPTEADTDDWPTRVKRHVDELQEQRGTAQCVGVAAPGIAQPFGSHIRWMQGRLKGVEGLDWEQYLGRGGHDDHVPVLNDAQAALLGEVWLGAARGFRNVAMLTLGTGVGGALMVDGRLLRGAIGRAGHLGHISLDPDGPPDVTNCPGSLEHAIGNVTLAERTGGRFTSTHDLIAAHRRGDDPGATAAWLKSVRALGAGVTSIINVADPDVVVIGGGIASAGEALFQPLAKFLDGYEWRPHGHRVRVVPAALGEYAGALGAAYNVIHAGGE